MWNLRVLIFFSLTLFNSLNASDENDEPVLYYYGLEESERSLSLCRVKQACSALVLRYWRAPALVRLCRCARRQRCDTRAPHHRLIELNNRAYLQFCTPVTNWPHCSIDDIPLQVDTSYERMNPDELEDLHHKNIQLIPPKIILNCQCHHPNYWRANSSDDDDHVPNTYKCGSLPVCKSGDFCGNVSYDLHALYQSCLCPKGHICVHSGGITRYYISELLYRGLGWRAHCQPVNGDYNYDDY